ncbi:LOW QUALITY PROTEIN: protein POF1B [Osmerus eperlanus]|uniref:LOW QUALITY PROTEIN: protein POF1B n=1 Tax=Osmerus eperlanus TaxID=29151 RepID=UPI002E147B5B
MSYPIAHNTSTYRTISVAAEPSNTLLSNTNTYRTINVAAEPSNTVLSNTNTYRTISVAAEPSNTVLSNTNTVLSNANMVNYSQLSPLPYGLNSSYETVRYLVPVQQPAQQSYVLVNNAPQVMPQMMSTVYLQNVPSASVSSLEDSEFMYRQQISEHVNGNSSSVFSQTPSPVKSPEPSVEEEVVEEEEEEEEVQETVKVEEKVVERVVERVSQVHLKEVEPLVKMDTRFFGELLAEVYRKNCDIHTCISEHVAKIRGRKHLLDPSNDYKMERDEVENLIPRGASELTKQQIRYLLQTRVTADKSMRLLLTTFSSLREELLHMSEDLHRLESEKESLERDLSFKADQAQQYDRLLEAVRENNRQLQVSLKESSSSQRSLERQLLEYQSSGSGQDFRIKEVEGSLRVLQKENDMLRQKLAGQGSSSSLQVKTEELALQYNQQLISLRQEKDKELEMLRSQMTRIQTEYSSERSGDRSLQLRITELLTSLEQRETIIRRQEEEIRRLQTVKSDSSKNVTQTVITNRYRNQYPLLGLLSDEFQSTHQPSIKEAKTIVIKTTTGEMTQQETISSP